MSGYTTILTKKIIYVARAKCLLTVSQLEVSLVIISDFDKGIIKSLQQLREDFLSK